MNMDSGRKSVQTLVFSKKHTHTYRLPVGMLNEGRILLFFFFGMSANFNKLKAPALEVG